MASELSRFIEDELRNKGYAYEEDDNEVDNPHASLMGALRVEVNQPAGRCRSLGYLFASITRPTPHAGTGEGPGDTKEAFQLEARSLHWRRHTAGHSRLDAAGVVQL